jgi:hypothetical protein
LIATLLLPGSNRVAADAVLVCGTDKDVFAPTAGYLLLSDHHAKRFNFYPKTGLFTWRAAICCAALKNKRYFR